MNGFMDQNRPNCPPGPPSPPPGQVSCPSPHPLTCALVLAEQVRAEAFKAKYNREPDASAATAFDAYNMLVDAIERAGTDDSELIRQEMYNTKDFEGASGTNNITENGDAEKSCVIQGFVNGEKQIISIVEP